jgi:hypothetical protein
MSEQLIAQPQTRPHLLSAECWCHPRHEYVPAAGEGDGDE